MQYVSQINETIQNIFRDDARSKVRSFYEESYAIFISFKDVVLFRNVDSFLNLEGAGISVRGTICPLV